MGRLFWKFSLPISGVTEDKNGGAKIIMFKATTFPFYEVKFQSYAHFVAQH